MRSPCTTMKNSPRSPQLEKARTQQRRPNAAKNKLKKKKMFTLTSSQVGEIAWSLEQGHVVEESKGSPKVPSPDPLKGEGQFPCPWE